MTPTTRTAGAVSTNNPPAPPPPIDYSPAIVLGVIGSDCHAVGNKIIEHALRNAGFNVVNLGVMVSQDEFIDAAIETGARAILVSSIYGHGRIDCDGLRGRCLERGLDDVLLYVGGNLVIGKHDFAEVEATFTAMGYDRVFPPTIDLGVVASLLGDDLGLPTARAIVRS